MQKYKVLQLIEKTTRNKQTELNLSENELTSLPSEIEELKNLTELDLSYNRLKTLPSEIEELKNLTKLDLSGNPMESPPLWILPTRGLKR